MEFKYDMSRDYRPIPPGEQGLPIVTAEKFHLVTRERPKHTEGVIFDKNGDMYFTSTYQGRIFRLNMQTMERECLWYDPDLKPVSVKLDRKGRIFISCLGTANKSGRIVVLGSDLKEERVLAEGRDIDDVAFDADGNLYYTHFIGTVYNPVGGIYKITPDMEHEELFMGNLCSPNGVCFSTDYKIMWITEFTAGRLLRIPMGSPYGSVVYHFTGYYGPDSVSVDAADNVYVCLFDQGRVMIFNPDGYPIGQILMPNREVGHNLGSAHAMVKPGTKDCYIACADDNGNEGSWIMKAPALAEGNSKAYHLT